MCRRCASAQGAEKRFPTVDGCVNDPTSPHDSIPIQYDTVPYDTMSCNYNKLSYTFTLYRHSILSLYTVPLSLFTVTIYCYSTKLLSAVPLFHPVTINQYCHCLPSLCTVTPFHHPMASLHTMTLHRHTLPSLCAITQCHHSIPLPTLSLYIPSAEIDARIYQRVR